MSAKKRSWSGRVFIGRGEHGKQQFHWVGRFPTKRERDNAVAKARTERPWEAREADTITCAEWVERYLDRYARTSKASSLDTARNALKGFRAEYGHRPVASITPVEAEDWAQTVPASYTSHIVAMLNYAKRMQIIAANPFDGLGGARGRGRADENPPTVEEIDRLLDACDTLGGYAQQMRALITFAAYTGMRPGELYELRWTDIDLAANRITVSRRLYRGRVDTPKSGKPKTIALPPPARDVLLRQPTRTEEHVFLSMRGRRLSASTVCMYWAIIRQAARLDPSYDFYRCTKHLGVHRLYRLGLSRRAIAAQMGWSERSVDALLGVYGHTELVALAEVDALYQNQGGSDAPVTQDARNRPS